MLGTESVGEYAEWSLICPGGFAIEDLFYGLLRNVHSAGLIKQIESLCNKYRYKANYQNEENENDLDCFINTHKNVDITAYTGLTR